jgi:hypothetical protein
MAAGKANSSVYRISLGPKYATIWIAEKTERMALIGR